MSLLKNECISEEFKDKKRMESRNVVGRELALHIKLLENKQHPINYLSIKILIQMNIFLCLCHRKDKVMLHASYE